jgi:hypothetical protein
MGESKPIYEGIYTVEGHGKGYFYFTWMAAWSSDWSSNTTIKAFDHSFVLCFTFSFNLLLVCATVCPSYAEAECNSKLYLDWLITRPFYFFLSKLYNRRRFVRRIKELHGEQTKNSNN